MVPQFFYLRSAARYQNSRTGRVELEFSQLQGA
eukprot:COSAG01_NODE_36519_length_516_cov_1.995204_1_plen_32_part_10